MKDKASKTEYKFLKPNDIFVDSIHLAKKIIDSDSAPHFLIGVWRGGAPVALYVQGYLEKEGVFVDHIPIRSSLYKSPNQRKDTVGVHGLEYVTKRVQPHHTVLIVDDVFDSGLTMDSIVRSIKSDAGQNAPENIQIATLFYKPEKNKTKVTPDFYVHEVTDEWIVFPHEISDMPPGQFDIELQETTEMTKENRTFFG
jgi:hypothetical protein